MQNEEFFRAIGVELSESLAELVRCHGDSGAAESDAAKAATDLENLGNAVLRCIHALYLYEELHIYDRDTLAYRLRLFVSHATNVLYEIFSLEKFIVMPTSRGKKKRKTSSPQLGIAAKVVGAVFLHCGFWSAFKFVKPICESAPSLNGAVYKDLIKQYAQKIRTTPRYMIVGRDVSSLPAIYTSSLVIGKKIATGTGSSRKRAEGEATREFCEQYLLHEDDVELSDNASVGIPESCKELLSSIWLETGLSEPRFDMDELEETFAAHTLSTEVGKDDAYAALDYFGSLVLEMCANEHLIEGRTISSEATDPSLGVLICNDVIAQFVPDSIPLDVLTEARMDGQGVDDIRANATKSLIGLLVRRAYWIRKDAEDEDHTDDSDLADIVMSILDIAEHYDGTKPIDEVRQVVEKRGLSLTWTSLDKQDDVANDTFSCEVSITSDDWAISAKGSSNSHRGAQIEACRNIAVSLYERCVEDDANAKNSDSSTEEDALQDNSEAQNKRKVESPSVDDGSAKVLDNEHYQSDGAKQTIDAESQSASSPTDVDKDTIRSLSEDEQDSEPKIIETFQAGQEVSPAGAKIEQPISSEERESETEGSYGASQSLQGKDIATVKVQGADTQDKLEGEQTTACDERETPAPTITNEANLTHDMGSATDGKGGDVALDSCDDPAVSQPIAHSVRDAPPVKYDGFRLYVCREPDGCAHLGHVLLKGVQSIGTLSGDEVELGVFHCESCGVNLMDYASYKKYRSSLGPFIGQFTIIRRWNAIEALPLRHDEPALMMCGYLVNKAIGLTEGQRHRILENAIKQDTITKEVACEHLEHFISYAQGRPAMCEMTEKWRQDLEWLQNEL